MSVRSPLGRGVTTLNDLFTREDVGCGLGARSGAVEVMLGEGPGSREGRSLAAPSWASLPSRGSAPASDEG